EGSKERGASSKDANPDKGEGHDACDGCNCRERADCDFASAEPNPEMQQHVVQHHVRLGRPNRPPQKRPLEAGQPYAECLVPPEGFGSEMVGAEQGSESQWKG